MIQNENMSYMFLSLLADKIKVLVVTGHDVGQRQVHRLARKKLAHPKRPSRVLAGLEVPDDYEGHPLRKEFPIDTPWGYRPAPLDEEG